MKKFETAIDLINGAVVSIMMHAPNGDKKKGNLRQLVHASMILEAAEKVDPEEIEFFLESINRYYSGPLVDFKGAHQLDDFIKALKGVVDEDDKKPDGEGKVGSD